MNEQYSIQPIPIEHKYCAIGERIFAFDKTLDKWAYNYLDKLSHTEIPQRFLVTSDDPLAFGGYVLTESGELHKRRQSDTDRFVLAAYPALPGMRLISDWDVNKWIEEGCPKKILLEVKSLHVPTDSDTEYESADTMKKWNRITPKLNQNHIICIWMQ